MKSIFVIAEMRSSSYTYVIGHGFFFFMTCVDYIIQCDSILFLLNLNLRDQCFID